MRIVSAASLIKRRELSLGSNSIGSALPSGCSLVPSASVPLRMRRVPISFLLACLVDDVVPSSYSVPLMPAIL